jgi:hypothetical protein
MRALLAALSIAAAAGFARADSGPALKTINNPSGGQVVYGIFDQESTLQGAMVSMLRKVHANFGERPQIGQFFQTRDQRTMGTFFTVAAKNQGGKPIAGMVMVTMPNGLKPAAAVLFDDAARFKTTEPQLMKKLTEAFNSTPASSSAASTASPNPAASPEHHGTGGPIAALQQAAVGDNSASIGLPAGWHISGGGGGSLHAEGPKGESIHMGVINQNIYDPNTQQGQNMINYMSKGRTPFTVCPFTSDLVAGYQCVARQNRQRNHLPQLSMKVNSVKNLGQGAVLVAAEIDFNDGKGPMTASIRLGVIRSGPAMWALTVDQANVPVALADQEWPTIGAMAASYRQNGQVIQAQTDQVIANIHAQGRANQARVDEHNREVDQNKVDFENHMDNIDRQSKAQQNYTLDQSVLQDNEIPARGTVTNPTADAFVRANPDRYQIVPKQDWIKGQDY